MARPTPDFFALHHAITTKDLLRALAKLAAPKIPLHSISLYFNYWARDGDFQVLHTQLLPGKHRPWPERREVSPAGEYLKAHPGVKMYRLDQLIPDPNALHDSPYFKHVMKEEGWRYLLVRTFWWRNRPETLVAFRRTQDQGDFGRRELAFIEELDAHIRIALARIRRVQRLEIKSLCLTSSLEHLRQGVLLCDWKLHPIFSNREGIHACRTWTHGGRTANRLRPALPVRLPPEIEELAHLLRKQWAAAQGEKQKQALLAPRSTFSPAEKKLTAIVQVVRSKQHALSEPFLLVQFVDVHTSQEWIERHSLQRNLHLERLTSRERDVAHLALRGLANKRISQELGKSLATVKAQLTSTYRKLRVRNRAELLVLLR